jgi:hypothetical protein
MIFFMSKKEKFLNKFNKKVVINEKFNKIKTITNQKVLKYFGSDGCPHSNKKSKMYQIVNEGFRNFLKDNDYDCDIEIYWSGKNSNEQFQAANAEYVPTLTNGTFKHLTFGIDKKLQNKYEGKKLDNVVFQDMYDKL